MYFCFNLVFFLNLEENSSKEKRLNELQSLLLDRYAVFKKIGDKYELTNRRYQQKAEEFTPSHIKVMKYPVPKNLLVPFPLILGALGR